MARDLITIRERLIRIETLLGNHLRHHLIVTAYILCPLLIGIILIFIKVWLR